MASVLQPIVSIAVLLAIGVLPLNGQPATSHTEDGLAIGIIYDTSGSMLEQVKDASGVMAPKYQIANRALVAIINRLQLFESTAPKDRPRKIQAGLFVFDRDRARAAVPLGTFAPNDLQAWVRSFSKPEGSTPLGEAVRAAGEAILSAKASRKHVLILTDGVNTRGPDPAAIIPRLTQEASRKETTIFFHFVAFDVDSNVFARVKKLGATVLGAADEKQLNVQLEFILEEKILLEAESPNKQ